MSNKILLIDDDLNYRSLLERRVLSIFPDAIIDRADNLSQARSILSENRYQLVILDQHLPDGKGSDLLCERTLFNEAPVLSMSSDTSPEVSAALIGQGAKFFLNKRDLSQAIFPSLLKAIVERSIFEKELRKKQIEKERLDTIKTLVATLKHEINNPLGAVFGAAYLIKSGSQDKAQLETVNLLEESAQRIKHVLDQLCSTIAIEPVDKASHKVYQIPGDKNW
jgi:response regulator of citrate/malate metabolism